MQVLPYDRIIALLTLKQDMVVLFQLPDNSLCKRVHQAIMSNELKYEQYGFNLYALNIDKYSAKYKETACIHVPKIKVFINGECRKEIQGIPDNTELERLLKGTF